MSGVKITRPILFVRNISKNVTREAVWNVFSNLGFGIIHNIVLKKGGEYNDAIVYYEEWNLDETQYTRQMLCSGKSLNVSYDYESKPWKILRYDENLNKKETQDFSDVLHKNVTDNRKYRKKERDMRCYAPSKAPRNTNAEHSQRILDDVRQNLFPFPKINN